PGGPFKIGCAVKPSHNPIPLVRGELALIDKPAQVALDCAKPFLEQFVRHFDYSHVASGLGYDLSDAAAHQSASKYGYVLDPHINVSLRGQSCGVYGAGFFHGT